MTRWDDGVRERAAIHSRRRTVSRPTATTSRPLLAGYWSFGQFWGVWVIVVFEFQRYHRHPDARIGVDYTLHGR